MDIKRWLLDHEKRQVIQRIDDDYTKHLNFAEYNKTVGYGKQHTGIDGVNPKLQLLKETGADKYKDDIREIIVNSSEAEGKLYEEFVKWKDKSDKSKKLILILIGIWIIGKLPLPIGIKDIFYLLSPLSLLLVLLFLVITIVLNLIRNKKKENYLEFERELKKKINNRTSQFANLCISFYKDIDSLYLHSLSPEQYQIEMMKREMDRRDREHQKEIESMQRSMQNMAHEFGRAMENLSKGMSEAQDRTANELRKIRENQEDRYRY